MMGKLTFAYEMQMDFSSPVTVHHYTLRCIPQDNEKQTIRNLRLEVSPEGGLRYGRDSFGNSYIYGCCREAHSVFSVRVTGEAETGPQKSGSVLPDHQLGPFRMQTRLTAPGERLMTLYGMLPPFDAENGDVRARTRLRMEQVYAGMRYLPGSTGTATTAEAAAAAGTGVCQDYSHILLSLLRMDAIACRYVCGMMTGEGASHAWVEVAGPGGWEGFDPTNHCKADENYVILSVGRDADDCPINRGIFRGDAAQTSRISVSVVPAEKSNGKEKDSFDSDSNQCQPSG